MYRDDTQAARAQLAHLEREVARHRSARATLSSYRNALVGELQRLDHALVWYVNGERHGFNSLPNRDDLSPAQFAEPAGRATDGAHANLSMPEITARTAAILRELAERDPGCEELRKQIATLEAQCAELRAEVEKLAARHPDHPPPPEYRPTAWTVLVPIGIVVAALAAAALFTL